ncbi:MAG TPA: Gfo/Idh/MocA family oxidoreductase [Capsulimonadaceae bacterium]|nr:Gfo/Idh/MocA family oxidoreductase [Capsulimonadaceae bacterium]
MAKVYRLGIAEMSHDHVWGELSHWKSLPNVEIVAAADPNQPLRSKVQAEYGVGKLYEDWREMLEKEELDILQVASPNSEHAEIIEAAAERHIHAMCEKPMAARLYQANRMLVAAEKAGITLMINWPTAWSPAIQELERRLLAGEIGQVFYFKYRAEHNGPKEIGCSEYFWGWLYDAEKNGAGAYMDYCCYAADMAARFFGLPSEVTGMRGKFVKTYSVPDDNAEVVMKYPHGFALAEACWTQRVGYALPNPVAYGTEGALMVQGGKILHYKPSASDPEAIPAPPTVAPKQNGPQYMIHCLETGAPLEGFCSAKVCRDAQEILEAGLISSDTGQTMTLPLQSVPNR